MVVAPLAAGISRGSRYDEIASAFRLAFLQHMPAQEQRAGVCEIDVT
jgi:hypothetical protein